MKIIGHRGARGLAPENTIASLRKGLEHHVDELEFDLHVTKDGVVILNHDRNVHDAAGNNLSIATHAYQELKAHKPDLATFQDVLDQIGRQVTLHAEVKKNVPIEPIVKIIKAQLQNDWVEQDFLLASSNQKTLRDLHRELPAIQKVVIEKWSGIRATRRAKQVNTKRLSMNQRWLWWGFIAAMHRGGYELYGYTLNNPRKAQRWAKYGFSGPITDYPDRFEK